MLTDSDPKVLTPAQALGVALSIPMSELVMSDCQVVMSDCQAYAVAMLEHLHKMGFDVVALVQEC